MYYYQPSYVVQSEQFIYLNIIKCSNFEVFDIVSILFEIETRNFYCENFVVHVSF